MPRVRPLPSKGRPPVPAPRIQVTLSLPPELLEWIDALAEQEERSRSKFVEIAMRKYLEGAAA